MRNVVGKAQADGRVIAGVIVRWAMGSRLTMKAAVAVGRGMVRRSPLLSSSGSIVATRLGAPRLERGGRTRRVGIAAAPARSSMTAASRY
jgi:hypothetical protein